jgi:uroporphyrinogen decarboxylase
MMYNQPQAWAVLMEKLVSVLGDYAIEQARAGAGALQVFDSWVGCLSVDDYLQYALPYTTKLIARLKATGVPVIYFGTDTATLLRHMQKTGADVIGLDWRAPLDRGWKSLDHACAVQGNLDPVMLFADKKLLLGRAEDILRQANGRPGHIFNLGHGILPETPVENVQALVRHVHEFSEELLAKAARQ